MFKSLWVASLFFVGCASAADAPSPYEPLAFLTGHCWKGELPGGRGMDTHCFTHIYGEKFVRDMHTVHANAHPDYLGESIYFWDGTSKKLKYLYVESDGGSSEGIVDSTNDSLIFPSTDYQEDGKIQTYRSRWTKGAADAYDVLTEFKKGDAWTLGWKVHMTKVEK